MGIWKIIYISSHAWFLSNVIFEMMNTGTCKQERDQLLTVYLQPSKLNNTFTILNSSPQNSLALIQ